MQTAHNSAFAVRDSPDARFMLNASMKVYPRYRSWRKYTPLPCKCQRVYAPVICLLPSLEIESLAITDL